MVNIWLLLRKGDMRGKKETVRKKEKVKKEKKKESKNKEKKHMDSLLHQIESNK